MVGMLSTYAEAEKTLNEMISLGYNDAFIVPYLDGVRITRSEMYELTDEYPDLSNYLDRVKE